MTTADTQTLYENRAPAPDGYTSAINRRQRLFLRTLVRRAFAIPPIQHDFACGTGRGIRLLEGLVRRAHGYDTPAVLARAGQPGVRAELHLVAAEGPVPSPAPAATPAVVTVFRPLVNLRDDADQRAIAFAARALPDYEAGMLIIENPHDEVSAQLGRYGFTMVERRGFTLFSPRWYARFWLRPLVRLVDDVVARIPGLSRYAVNVLGVARRTHPAVRPADVLPPHPDATSW